MAISRKDPKGRKLKDGESYRSSDERYQYRYSLGNGKRHIIYAKTLEELRKKEEEVKDNQRNNVKTNVARVTLNDIFELYMSGKTELKASTRTNYNYMYNNYVRDELGVRKIVSIKYSDWSYVKI